MEYKKWWKYRMCSKRTGRLWWKCDGAETHAPIGKIFYWITKARHMLKHFCNIEYETNVDEIVHVARMIILYTVQCQVILWKKVYFNSKSIRGINDEPILVWDVLRHGTWLSWEPIVTFRALCGNSASSGSSNDTSKVKVIGWLSNCELYFLWLLIE
jgi:hypothetical protein